MFLQRFSICLSIIFFCSLLYGGQRKVQDTFLIKGANWESVAHYMSFLEDQSRVLGIYDAIALEEEHQFDRRREHRVFNSGYTRSNYWLSLPIKNITDQDLQLVWSFYNNSFKVTFYDVTTSDKPLLLGQVSADDPVDHRLFRSRALCLPINLAPHEYRKIMAKLELNNTNYLYFLSDVTTVEDMMFWELNYAMVVGQFLGYFLFIFLINIFLYFFLKQDIHIWHACYVLSIILFSLSENIVDVLILPHWFYVFFLKFSKVFWLLISLYFCIKVFQMFTEQEEKFPMLFRLLSWIRRFTFYLILLTGLQCLFFNVAMPGIFQFSMFQDVFLLIGYTVLFFIILYSSIRKDKGSFYFLLATLFILLAFINFILDIIWQLSLFYLQPGNILVGLMIEVTLLTGLFLMKIIRQSKINRENFELKTLENQRMSRQMLVLQEEERKAIAQEIHDGVGSHLSGLRLYLQTLFSSNQPITDLKKKEVLREMKTIYQDLRNISHDLMPAYIEEQPLSDLLINKLEQCGRQFPQIVFSHFEKFSDQRISQSKKLHIYRIVTALLDNSIKHSQCTEISFQVYVEDTMMEVILEDNGIGFDTNYEKSFSGIGLRSVRSRVDYLEATIFVESNLNGSSFIIQIPL